MSYATPYAGLKIVDITQGFAGPYCAGIFALYGADVIKVEPFEGDWIRAIGESYGGQTPLGMVANPQMQWPTFESSGHTKLQGKCVLVGKRRVSSI